MKNLDKKKKKVYNRSDYFLLGIFILLIIVCIGLIGGVVIAKKNHDNNNLILIPVVENNLDTVLEINIGKKKKDDIINYRFKVNNYYRDSNGKDIVNKKNVKYFINVANNVDATYELFKDNENIKLKDYKTKYFVLKKDKKSTDSYKLVIKLKENITKDKFIYLNVKGVEYGNNK